MLLKHKEKVKKIISWLQIRLDFIFQTYLYGRKYKALDKILFEKTLPDEVIKKYKKKWSIYGFPVETKTLLLSYNLSGELDYNIVPENIFSGVVESMLNKYKGKHLEFLSVKNIYERWYLNNNVFPDSYLHKMDGIFYDKNLKIIESIEDYLNNIVFEYPLICKPSLDTSSGDGVETVTNIDKLKLLLNSSENLVVQEKLIQNLEISNINPNINTIRTCLYRDKSGFFKVLNNSIRFGVDGGLDNEGTGGIFCNIKDDGRLNSYAVNKNCEKFFKHPNSGAVFSDFVIPYYDELHITSESIANQIPLCNLVSLDMCLDINNNWRCVEINLRGQATRLSQYAGKGFFGAYTNEVIEKTTIKKEIKK